MRCHFRCAVFAIVLTGILPRHAGGEDLPAWVVAEKEPLPLKRDSAPSYLEITATATIVRPKALTKAEDLEKLNPGVMAMLPGLRDMVSKATVSSKFKKLYDAKIKLAAEGAWLPQHSYFDCATVLNVRDAKSGRSAVVFQADMDTDTDGTDPVRLPVLKDYDDARISRSFQPILAYSWSAAGSGNAINPFPKYYADTLDQLRKLKQQVDGFAQSDPGPVWQDLRKRLDEQLTSLSRSAKYYHRDLVSRRSLVASLDPFIVVPQNWLEGRMAVGDLALVIYANHIYPCIIGDTGPKAKSGEASQRLARAINPKASGKVSAVTHPGVTYVVFPGTRAAMDVPNPARLNSELGRMAGELGGLGPGVKLHEW